MYKTKEYSFNMITDQERIDIVRNRMECAENTLGEIENLFALKYYNNAAKTGCTTHAIMQ